MPQYFEATNQKAIRQYAEIIAMTDDVDKITNYRELSEPALYESIALKVERSILKNLAN